MQNYVRTEGSTHDRLDVAKHQMHRQFQKRYLMHGQYGPEYQERR